VLLSYQPPLYQWSGLLYVVWLFRCWCICVPRHDGCWILFARKTSRKSVHMVIKRSHVRSLCFHTSFGSCVLKTSAVEFWLIPLILLNGPSTDTWSVLDCHSINPSIDSWLTQNQHLGWQSVESRLIIDWCIWISRQTRHVRLLTSCWSSVNEVSSEMPTECQPSIERNVNWVLIKMLIKARPWVNQGYRLILNRKCL